MPIPVKSVTVRPGLMIRRVARPNTPPTKTAKNKTYTIRLKLRNFTSADFDRQIKGEIIARFLILADDLGDTVRHTEKETKNNFNAYICNKTRRLVEHFFEIGIIGRLS